MYRKFLKRIIDILVSLILLILLSPIILIITLVLFFTNEGEPFFYQERPGFMERKIHIIKFKSMNNKKNADGILLSDNYRITVMGKLLRSTSLDELPQLFNVLKGELKLVGLRPVSEVYFNALHEDYKDMRINYKPGCIPPYVALNKKPSKEEVIEAEYEYIKMKKSNPYTTDFILFFRALTNIIAFNKRGT